MNFNYKNPSTPEQLMRNRYEAFVNKDANYLNTTTLQPISYDMTHYENTQWLKLDVITCKGNSVEFKAYFEENGLIHLLHEKSNFIEANGMWKYASGELFNSKIQRNESCPCGSSKKYKKCCMKN
ncbi:MAG: SEC-C domain-containing protein [Sulfurimonas sp.]|nr:SEC-C domain-containing protein [Sulfurimonas sp.]